MNTSPATRTVTVRDALAQFSIEDVLAVEAAFPDRADEILAWNAPADAAFAFVARARAAVERGALSIGFDEPLAPVVVRNIRHKDSSRYGQGSPVRGGGLNVAVTPGQSIRIWGVVMRYNGDTSRLVTVDRTFRVGDEVKTGSYNLVYTALISGIGRATIETPVEGSSRGKKRRFDLGSFVDKNVDLDLDRIARENELTYRHI